MARGNGGMVSYNGGLSNPRVVRVLSIFQVVFFRSLCSWLTSLIWCLAFDFDAMTDAVKMTSELNFTLEREQIDNEMVEQLEQAGISFKHFACLVPDQDAMRMLAKLPFTGEEDFAGLANLARLICAMGGCENTYRRS